MVEFFRTSQGSFDHENLNTFSADAWVESIFPWSRSSENTESKKKIELPNYGKLDID